MRPRRLSLLVSLTCTWFQYQDLQRAPVVYVEWTSQSPFTNFACAQGTGKRRCCEEMTREMRMLGDGARSADTSNEDDCLA